MDDIEMEGYNYHHPLPPRKELEEIVLGYEVDQAFWLKRKDYDGLSLEGLWKYINDYYLIPKQIPFAPAVLKYRYPQDSSTCVNIVYAKNGAPIPIKKVRLVQKFLGWELGIFPDTFYEFLPDGDKDYLRKYRYSFMIKCRHGIGDCIRPDHLALFTYLGIPIQGETKS